MTWAAWLVGLATPLVTRVLVALGFAYVTHEGVKGVIIAVLQNIAGSFGGLAGEVTAILARSGFFLAMSILSGGIIGGIAYGLTTKLVVASGQTQGD
jgi:hypothetical protein